LSLHAQADAPGDDDARMADAQEMAEAARRAIYKDFVTKYSAPKNQVAQDLLTAYIEALVESDALGGEAHGERDIAALKGMFDDALKVVTQIAARALVGADGKPLDSASTGPSPADAQLGLYNDFKKFVLSRAQGGRESEDKAKILYLEAQISELQAICSPPTPGASDSSTRFSRNFSTSPTVKPPGPSASSTGCARSTISRSTRRS